MEKQNKTIEPYGIPFREKSRFSFWQHVIIIIFITAFSFMVFLPESAYAYKALCAALALLFIYNWIFTGILRKTSLEITAAHISMTSAYGTKRLLWSDALDVAVYSVNKNKFVGVLAKDKKKSGSTAWKRLNEALVGNFYISISMATFPQLDEEMLYMTIKEQIINSYQKQVDNKSKDEGAVKERQSSLTKALYRSFAVSILFGIVYGISIFMFKTNIILVPIAGIVVMSYVYNSNYQEEQINFIVRLILGLISSTQIIVGFLVCELIYSGLPLYPINIYYIIREYLRYTLENPIDQALLIFLAVVCFIYGAVQDYTFRFQMLFRKPFMKKWGNYYCKKEGHMLSIYIIDPVDFNENHRNRLIAYVTEGCYIEKQKKRVRAFYLPKSNLDEAEIYIQNDGIITIRDKQYYKLDLGSAGEYQSYVYPCSLLLDDKQNVELIQIEI